MKVLVTGGAGYIGSTTSSELIRQGHEVVIFDNLTTGSKKLLPVGAKFIFGDILDEHLLARVMRDERVQAVIHFAAKLYVEESVRQPFDYYSTNVSGSLNVLQACKKNDIRQFVFSSTAAVYGSPEGGTVDEQAPIFPLNPYGHSKAMIERILFDLRDTGDLLRAAVLRYFNVAGSSLDLNHGEIYSNSTHLVKVAALAACGKRDQFFIHGTDYPTPDGTGVRDYIHVQDLARAHVDALMYLDRGGKTDVFNCGYGKGYSVREVLNTMQEVSGVEFKIIEGPRRAGDAVSIVADSSKAKDILNWTPQFDDLKLICKSALDWERTLS